MKSQSRHQQPNQREDLFVEFGTPSPKKYRLSAIVFAALACGAVFATGCSQGGNPASGGGSGSGPAVNITGNWQMTMTSSGSQAPISSMAGYLSDPGTGNNLFTTAALTAQTSGCFADASTVPMYGQTSGSDVNLASFAIESQTLSLNVQANTAGNQFSGNYSIAGGCAGGAKGTVTGTEYASMTGTFSGSIPGSSPTVTVSLTLSQNPAGTGLGTFPLSGSAGFTGISCFTQGTLAATDGTVIGDTFNLPMTTNDAQGGKILMTGTLDPAAKTLTVTSIQITGGSCAGTLGSATLVRVL